MFCFAILHFPVLNSNQTSKCLCLPTFTFSGLKIQIKFFVCHLNILAFFQLFKFKATSECFCFAILPFFSLKFHFDNKFNVSNGFYNTNQNSHPVDCLTKPRASVENFPPPVWKSRLTGNDCQSWTNVFKHSPVCYSDQKLVLLFVSM